ncbi:MAG TPA: hypothetical protein VGR69_06410 [Candidatus Rubrimentiphilum sp.]|nr:hypothetical protein [Candidatus Rubrimentiphilum sp.]
MNYVRTIFVVAVILLGAQPTFAQITVAPPLPFTPPASWAQVPRGFALTEFKNLWQGTSVRQGRGRGLFVEAILPIPAGLLNAILLQARSAVAKSKAPLPPAKTVLTRICGATASVSTMRVTGKNPAIIEGTVFSRNAITYAAIYFRPIGANPSAIESAIRTACPLPDGNLPTATPPAGWTAMNQGLDFALGGIWLGNGPMQMMTLAQGHRIPDPETVASMFKPMIVQKNGQVKSSISTRHFKACGQTGVLINTRFIIPPGFGFSYDLAAAQSGTQTYLLSYAHPTSFTDPAAEQSLTTLCGSPAFTPSPTPTATP